MASGGRHPRERTETLSGGWSLSTCQPGCMGAGPGRCQMDITAHRPTAADSSLHPWLTQGLGVSWSLPWHPPQRPGFTSSLACIGWLPLSQARVHDTQDWETAGSFLKLHLQAATQLFPQATLINWALAWGPRSGHLGDRKSPREASEIRTGRGQAVSATHLGSGGAGLSVTLCPSRVGRNRPGPGEGHE